MIFPKPVGLTGQHSIKVQDTLDLESVIYFFATNRFVLDCFILFYFYYIFIIIVVNFFFTFIRYFYLHLASLPVSFIYIFRTVVESILNDMEIKPTPKFPWL